LNSYKVRLIDVIFTSKVTAWGSKRGHQARKTTHAYRRNCIWNAAVNLGTAAGILLGLARPRKFRNTHRWESRSIDASFPACPAAISYCWVAARPDWTGRATTYSV